MPNLFKPTTADPKRSAQMPYRQRPLLSPAELRFFQALSSAVEGRWGISLKTRLADLVQCPPELWETPHGRRLSQKHVDFVLYDPRSASVAAIIELDDRSHESADRQARDVFVDSALHRAGLRILRVKASREYRVETLSRYLHLAVGRRKRRSTRRANATPFDFPA